jgi:hypothetical protein
LLQCCSVNDHAKKARPKKRQVLIRLEKRLPPILDPLQNARTWHISWEFAFDTGMSAVTLLLPALVNNSDSQTEHALQDRARCDRNGCC